MKSYIAVVLLVVSLQTRAVEWQPFKAQVTRMLEALDFQGAALSEAETRAIRQALETGSGEEAADRVESMLDKHVLVEVNINPESRVKVARGKAPAELMQSGWRAFLVKVVNEGGVTAELRAVSPQALSLFDSDWSK